VHEVKLIRREEVALGTMAFYFSKPAGFAFQPGQAVELVLPLDEDARRTFSLVSAPYQDELVVATRMRDSVFKRALKTLPSGSPARIEGPFGSLTLHEDRARAAVFIAGGIGITPFMSILRQAAQDRLALRLLLIYSNRRPEDAAFLAELQQLVQRNPGFRLAATMTEMAKSALPWNGETGLVDAGLIRRYSRDLPEPIYYIVGPPGMVEAMRGVLQGAGVGKDDIRTEEFFGY
jgi:ferredoxin-NADP reductase